MLSYAPNGISVSDHAIERWIQRVNPSASQAQAETEILGMVEAGGLGVAWPEWVKQQKFSNWERCVCWHGRPNVVLVVKSAPWSEAAVTTVLVKPDSQLEVPA